MRLILFLLILSTIFSNCHSNSSIDSAGKEDSTTVGAATNSPKHSKTHNVRGESHHEGTVSDNGGYSSSANQPETSAPQAEAPHKKGWSAAAKDAVIGGAVGAATGAIVDKNHRLAGGAIGAAIGTGAGYLIGRSRDRKTGRVVKHSASY